MRENIRAMLRRGPVLKTSEIWEALKIIDRETKLGLRKWLKASKLLQKILYVKRITEYLYR